MSDELDPRVLGAVPRPAHAVDPDAIWRTAQARNRRAAVLRTAAVAAAAVVMLGVATVVATTSRQVPPVITQPTDLHPTTDPTAVTEPDDEGATESAADASASPTMESSGPLAQPREEPTPTEPPITVVDEPPGPGASAEQLWGRTFVSVAATEDGEPRQFADGTRFELTFDREDRNGPLVRFWVGCNVFGAPSEITDDRILLADVSGSATDCGDEVMAQELWIVDVMRADPAWTLRDGTLTLRAGASTIEMVEGEPTYWP